MFKTEIKKADLDVIFKAYPEFLNAILELGISFAENNDTEFLCFINEKQERLFTFAYLFFELGLKQNEK